METLSWHCHEYFHTEKTSDWYWIVGIITITIAVVAIILNNVIFAILIIVSSFTLCLFASRRPDLVSISIDNLGLTVSKKRYPYGILESFWVETGEHYPRILFKTKKSFSNNLVIFIEEVEPEKIRELLLAHIKEEHQSEPFLEKLLLYLGF
jgi:hypothetical protein